MDESHRILGVKPPSSVAEVKQAYRKLAVLFHPDCDGSVVAFRKLQVAYEQLVDHYGRLEQNEAQQRRSRQLADDALAMMRSDKNSSADIEIMIAMLTESIDLAPTSVITLVRRGYLYFNLVNKHALAESDLNKAIGIDPQCVEAYVHRADMFWDAGYKDAAVRDCLHVLTFRPHYPGAYWILSRGICLF